MSNPVEKHRLLRVMSLGGIAEIVLDPDTPPIDKFNAAAHAAPSVARVQRCHVGRSPTARAQRGNQRSEDDRMNHEPKFTLLQARRRWP